MFDSQQHPPLSLNGVSIKRSSCEKDNDGYDLELKKSALGLKKDTEIYFRRKSFGIVYNNSEDFTPKLASDLNSAASAAQATAAAAVPVATKLKLKRKRDKSPSRSRSPSRSKSSRPAFAYKTSNIRHSHNFDKLIEKQEDAYCGAHALNNLLHNCPEYARFSHIIFTYDHPDILSTATHINLNNICKTNREKFLSENAQDTEFTGWETGADLTAELKCTPESGGYSENDLLRGLSVIGLKQKRFWTKGENKDNLKRAFLRHEDYGFLIKSGWHWICAVFKDGEYKVIDSVGSKEVTFDIKNTKSWLAVYVVYKLDEKFQILTRGSQANYQHYTSMAGYQVSPRVYPKTYTHENYYYEFKAISSNQGRGMIVLATLREDANATITNNEDHIIKIKTPGTGYERGETLKLIQLGVDEAIQDQDNLATIKIL